MKNTLKKIRVDNGLTQSEMADMIGVSRSCIANWERGIRQPDVLTIKRYNELFGYKDLFSKTFLKDQCNFGLYLDISELNEEGKAKIRKCYDELLSNPKYLKIP